MTLARKAESSLRLDGATGDERAIKKTLRGRPLEENTPFQRAELGGEGGVKLTRKAT